MVKKKSGRGRYPENDSAKVAQTRVSVSSGKDLKKGKKRGG